MSSSLAGRTRPGVLLEFMRLVASDGRMPLLSMNMRGLDRAQNRYASWGTPELITKRSVAAVSETQPADPMGVSAVAPKVTLEQRVKNSLAGRRAIYEAQALAAFKAGKYHEACDQLALADATAIEEPDQRVYLKLLFCYASLAAQQYQEALAALAWVLARGDRDGGRAVPGALRQLRNIETFYGDPKEFAAQVELVQRLVSQGDTSATASESVLRAIVAWGCNDMANAKFYARRAAEQEQQLGNQGLAVHQWSRLVDYMAAAEQSGKGAPFARLAPVETEKRPIATSRPGLLTLEAVPTASEK